MAEAGNALAARQPDRDGTLRIGNHRRVGEQRAHLVGHAAMQRANQSGEPGQHTGAKRCAGRCHHTHCIGGCVQFMVRRQHQGAADQIGGFRPGIPDRRQALMQRQ